MDEGKGQIQMMSGGFGDSTNLDEETMRILKQHQEDIVRKQLTYSSHWDPDSFTEDYTMESNMFDYKACLEQENFGLKKYQDSFYRGQLNQSNHRES